MVPYIVVICLPDLAGTTAAFEAGLPLYLAAGYWFLSLASTPPRHNSITYLPYNESSCKKSV